MVTAVLHLIRKIQGRDRRRIEAEATAAASNEAHAEPVNRRTIDAILLEYDVQTRDRRLYAQSMFGTIGFVVAGTVGLLAAATQAKEPLTLLLIPPLLLAGGILTVVLRIHLLRVSVFLTVVEEDLRSRLGAASYPIVWETTMTGRTEAVTSWSSPARSSAGLSLSLMLLLGVGLAAAFVWPATLLYWQTETAPGGGLIGSVSQLLSIPAGPVEWAYPALNLIFVTYIAYSWVRQPAVLDAARIHFRRTRARILAGSDEVYVDAVPGGRQLDQRGSWTARWEGIRDGEHVTLELGVGIPNRQAAERWARRRATRLSTRG